MTLLPRAVGVKELMDEPSVPGRELERALADLRAVNRWLGGARSVLAPLLGMIRGEGLGEVSVLDVATGSGDLPLALSSWGERAGVRLRVTGLDAHPLTTALARAHSGGDERVSLARGDAGALPFGDGGFDFAICSTTLHHFDAEAAVLVLREMARVARRGGVVGDLRRSVPGLFATRFLAATLWRTHPVTRHDGPLSVRRAYTLAEVRALAARAGLTRVAVSRAFPFRLALVWRP
ncbi:MAG: methyltransferase domain-containing protein [Longimicrobiaceae bacterium]